MAKLSLSKWSTKPDGLFSVLFVKPPCPRGRVRTGELGQRKCTVARFSFSLLLSLFTALQAPQAHPPPSESVPEYRLCTLVGSSFVVGKYIFMRALRSFIKMRRVSPGGIHKPWLYLPNRMRLRQSLCEELLKKHFNYLFLVICDHLIRMIIGSLFQIIQNLSLLQMSVFERALCEHPCVFGNPSNFFSFLLFYSRKVSSPEGFGGHYETTCFR